MKTKKEITAKIEELKSLNKKLDNQMERLFRRQDLSYEKAERIETRMLKTHNENTDEILRLKELLEN